MMRSTFVLLAALFLATGLWGQNDQFPFKTAASLDWIGEKLSAEASFDMAQAGIKLPAGRLLGEETLNEAYPRLLRPYLLSLQVDSNSTIKTLMDNGELSLEDIDKFYVEAEKIPPSLSSDLARMTGRYTVLLEKVSNFLGRNRRAFEPQKPLRQIQTSNYTGIIIIASDELPVHGRRTRAIAEPCLFPKIWDTDMNLVYEHAFFEKRNGLMVRYAVQENIFRPTPSGLDGELAALVGANPLRIIAREVFGVNPTDPVIDREDALKILSSENNHRLLSEGRVVLVLSNTALQTQQKN